LSEQNIIAIPYLGDDDKGVFFDDEVAAHERCEVSRGIKAASSCDLIDRMAFLDLPLSNVYRGQYTRIVAGRAHAVYDPAAMQGFVLWAGADTHMGKLDIGFGTNGQVLRSLLGDRIIHGDEALTLWILASKTPR